MTITQERTIAQLRVSDGAELLDEKMPGWWALVATPLEMDSTYDCVLGRLAQAKDVNITVSPYYTMTECLFGPSGDWRHYYPVHYGFDADHLVSFEELGDAWAVEIDHRMAA